MVNVISSFSVSSKPTFVIPIISYQVVLPMSVSETKMYNSVIFALNLYKIMGYFCQSCDIILFYYQVN